MKIYNSTIQNITGNDKQEKQQVAFKSGLTTILNSSGTIMQSVENGGFLASFLIQDGIGMTVPRTCAGFLRDKEKTGHYNTQEGLEVLGREGLTGPCMMAVAPLSLLLAAKFGRSTSVNTQLIKRFGNSLKEILSKPEFDKTLLKDANKFKSEFYKANIEKMLTESLGKENTTKESVDYIMKQIANMENIPAGTKLKKFRGKATYRNECMQNIIEHINNIKYSKSDDLNMLQKVKFGNEKLDSIKNFKTKDAIDAMIKYTDDAIVANKHLDKLDALEAESIKNKSLAKRMITNVAMIFTTLGVLSVLPKIYARGETAPGARKTTNVEDNNSDNNSENNVSFKGKGNPGWLERLGKLIGKNNSDFASHELEYNGHNFTNTLMAGLSVFGLLTPRCIHAYKRAQKDENGNKDLTELYEILLRDVSSSLAVVFAVPMLTRAFVTSYEKKLGFVLMHKDRNKNGFQTALDLMNPYTRTHVLSNAEITALYDNVNTKDKMLNFCKYIDKNGGDLAKVISKSENVEAMFNPSTLDLKSLEKLERKDKNKKIISFVEKFNKSDEIIAKVMKSAGKGRSNKIAAFARGLNSMPGLLTTFLVSPYLLGWFIPRLTYKNTNRIHEKQDREHAIKNQQNLSTNA